MVRRNVVFQQAAVIVGGLVGLALEWRCRPAANRELFLAAVAGAFVGTGFGAIVLGEFLLRGRHGPATRWQGAPARVLGLGVSVVGLIFYFVLRSLG
jgi:hypothetical protein